MPNLQDDIDLGILGDHFDVDREVTNVPDGQTVAEAWLTVKEIVDDDATDAAALFQKHITPSATATGQITDTGSGAGVDRRAEVLFHCLPADTFSWPENDKKEWDIQIKLSGGAINTPFRGTMKGIKGTTNKIT